MQQVTQSNKHIDNKEINDLDKPLWYNYQNQLRLLVFLPLAILLVEQIIANPLGNIVILSASSLLVIYSLIALLITRNSRPKSKKTHALLFFDAVLLGLTIGLLSYNILLGFISFCLLSLNSFSINRIQAWLLSLLGLMGGLSATYFGLGLQELSQPSMTLGQIPLAVCAIIYLMRYSQHSQEQQRSLEEKFEQQAETIKAQKLRNYEISKYLPRSAWELIEGKRTARIERKPITIFFSDIVGFTRLSEELEAETLSNILSSYLAEMSKIVEQYNGTIDKFIGDAIMVTFGDDRETSQGVKKDAIACVSMALAMGKRMRELQGSWAEMGIKKPLQIRIGINTGFCSVGTFGTSKHLDYTALGVHVNLASRLESAGQPEEILVSHETWSLIKDTILCKDKGQIKAKGFTHPVQVYQVMNFRREMGNTQSYFSQTNSGFAMHLDMQKIKNYDRDKVISSLELAVSKIKEKFPKS